VEAHNWRRIDNLRQLDLRSPPTKQHTFMTPLGRTIGGSDQGCQIALNKGGEIAPRQLGVTNVYFNYDFLLQFHQDETRATQKWSRRHITIVKRFSQGWRKRNNLFEKTETKRLQPQETFCMYFFFQTLTLQARSETSRVCWKVRICTYRITLTGVLREFSVSRGVLTYTNLRVFKCID